MLTGFVSKLLRHITKFRQLMAAKYPSTSPSPCPVVLPLLALVDFYPDADKLIIQLTLNGKFRSMDRSGSEQLSKCLKRIQLNACDKKQRGVNKKDTSTDPIPSSPTADLFFNNIPINSDLTNAEAWKEDCVLRVGTEEFHVRVDIPRVLSLSLPRHTLQGCSVIPHAKFSHCEMHSCQWSWCRVEDPEFCEKTLLQALSHGRVELSDQLMSTFKLFKVSDSYVYCPDSADVGYKLLVLCQPIDPISRQKVGINGYVTSATQVQLFPEMEGQVDRFERTRQLTDTNHLRVISYNILADMWTNSKDCQSVIYPHCSALSLDADYRRALTNRELINYHPDIVCLQEVSKHRYTDSLRPAMESVGFSGHFALKTGEMPEGEVILYRRDRFEVIDMYSLHSGEYMKIEENSVLYNSLLLWGGEVSYHFFSLGTIFQICILKDKSNPERVYLVANTHLHSRPAVPYLRLFQMALLVRHMERLVEQYKEKEGKVACVLLCGDFNSTPNTGLIQFIQTGMIESNNIDWQPWALNEPTKFVFPGISLSHSLQLFNACGPTSFTHFAAHYTGTLDYIYCDTQHFKIQEVAPMPALWEVSKETALPNTWFPSDHLPIVCDLKIK